MTEREIFAAALKLTGTQQVAFLDAACGQNIRLREQLDALLRAHNESGGRLPKPPARELEATQLFAGEAQPSMLIAGRYKLIETVGQGGMGTVWLAEQREPVKRKVAIKLVKAGMDSAQVLARFEAERQALAMMDHPNIARVFDGGVTEQGRPYFVMEFVKGVPLTEYCDQARLPLKDRLKLFIPVCQAVQHAHQKGIIHRDLKPSNILICLYDGKPVPKVIDFGLAKAMHHSLTEQTLHTASGMMVGTPLYMSPEQAEHNNLDVDTRTDIYSLGVILYELLTGSTPLEKQQLKAAAYDEILRLIKEVEPPKPSTRLSGSESLPSVAAQRSIEPNQLRRSLMGDLDWIVMKSLDKERSRRYETANELADDVERYLNDEAVEASPPRASYRLRKLLRKHRSAIGTATALAALLIAGTGISVWQAVRATKAKGDANLSAQYAIASETKAVAALKLVTQERDAKNAALTAESAQRELAERQFVAGVLRPIGYGVEPEEGELLSFVDWTALPDSRLKLKVLELAFENAESAFRLARRSDRTIQAAVGLSPHRRARTLEFLSAQQRQSQANPQIRVAACWLAMELGSSDLPALAETITWLGAPKSESPYWFVDFDKFITAMIRQRDELSPEHVALGADALVALLENSPKAQQRGITGEGLSVLVPRLSSEEVTHAWDALLNVLEQSKDNYPLPAVEYSLAALAPRLRHEQVTRAMDRLIGVLKTSMYPLFREVAGNGLAALAPQLDPEQATRCWDTLLPLLKNSTDPSTRLAASNGLAALARLSPEQATRAADALIVVVDNPTDYDALAAVNTLRRLAPWLSDEQVAHGWDALVALLEKSDRFDVQHAVGEELVGLALRLSPEQVSRGWDALLRLQEKSNLPVRNAAGRGLYGLAQRLHPEQAAHGWASQITLLKNSTDRIVLDDAGRKLLWLAPRLNPESATRAWDALFALLENATSSDIASIAGGGLSELASRLNPEQASRGGDSLLVLLERSPIDSVRSAAADGLAALATQLSPEQVARGCDALLTMLQKSTDGNVHREAVRGLSALAPRLSLEEATRSWDALVVMLEKSGDASVLEAVGDALAALVPRLSPEQVPRGLDALDILLQKNLAPGKLPEALVVRLSAMQGVQAAEAIVSTLAKSSNGNLAESLAVIVPLLEPASRDRLAETTLKMLLDQEVSFRDVYQARAYSYDHFSPASRAISNPKSLARLFTHLGCRGEQRNYMLQRFEELVLYDGRPVFLKPKATQGAEQTLTDSQATAPPPRRFRNLHDTAIWIQHNWPDFDLQACTPVTRRVGNRQS